MGHPAMGASDGGLTMRTQRWLDSQDPDIQALRGKMSGKAKRRRQSRRDYLIRCARRRGLTFRELGRRFGISHVMAWKVCNRRWMANRPWIHHPRGPALTQPVARQRRRRYQRENPLLGREVGREVGGRVVTPRARGPDDCDDCGVTLIPACTFCPACGLERYLMPACAVAVWAVPEPWPRMVASAVWAVPEPWPRMVATPWREGVVTRAKGTLPGNGFPLRIGRWVESRTP